MSTAPTYADSAADSRRTAETTSVGVILALSASHMLNDVMQSLAPALYPVFHEKLALSFFQIGVITFVFQLTASLLQPLIGLALDRRPLNVHPAGRHGLHPGRARAARLRQHLCADSARRSR